MRITRVLATVAAALAASTGLALTTDPAPAHAAEPLHYVALGDSFTSTGSIVGMDPGTFGSFGGPSCFRSADTYPAVLARSTGWRLTDVSCRGARVPLMYTGSPAYGAPQLDALDSSVDVVTMQVGGNDTDVLELAGHCLVSACGGLEPEWAAKVDRVRPGLAQLVRDVRARAPHATIALVGYLQPFPERPCVDVAPFSAANQGFGRRHVDRLNAMLRDVARSTGVGIAADTTPAGHSACDPDRWTSLLGVDAGAVPLHPTAAGHRGTAAQLQALLAG